MISYYFYSDSAKKFTKLKAFKKGCLVIVEDPTDKEVKVLTSLGLEKRLIKDAVNIHEVPRFEQHKSTQYLFIRLPILKPDFKSIPTLPALIASGDNAIFIVTKKEINDAWREDLVNLSQDNTNLNTTIISIIRLVIEQYQKRIIEIDRKVRIISTNVNFIKEKKIVELVNYDRIINDYLDSLSSVDEVTGALSNGQVKLTSSDKKSVQEIRQMNDNVSARYQRMLKSIHNIRDSYNIILSSKLNDTMKRLTIITLCLTIPTVVTGIFGMNVALPGNIDAPYYFWILMAASVIISYLLGRYYSKD